MSKINKAFILAGGEATRLRPITYEIPKPLLPVKGIPLMEYGIRLLAKYDVREIIIALGYLSHKIREYFGDGARFGVEIQYTEEQEPLGTAGPLLLAKEQLTETFFMFSGDILCAIDLEQFAKFHRGHNGLGTIAVTAVEDASRFGMIMLQNDKILDFVEKPKKTQQISQYVNTAYYILEPEVLDRITEGYCMIEKDIFPNLAKEGKLFGYRFDGQWFDVGTFSAYEEAIKNWEVRW
jgi:NDP-sugar pyrophosphorylase family protein